MSQVSILAFAGSLRRDSWNKKLVRVAARYAEAAGANVTVLDLKDYPLPVYDADIETEDGLPDAALKLKEIFKAHDAMIVSSPEYNGGLSGAFKNAIDWVSRPMEGEKPLEHFRGKPVGLLAASPGARGGARVLPKLREQMSDVLMLVVPEVFGLGNAGSAFDDDGALVEEFAATMTRKVAESVVRVATALA